MILGLDPNKVMPLPWSGCWIWLGADSGGGRGGGYAKVWRDGRSQYLHRWIWTQLYGEPPAELQIDHICSVRCCINPAHFELVTQSENMRRVYQRRTPS